MPNKNNKFWRWRNDRPPTTQEGAEPLPVTRTLYLDGEIAPEQMWDDDVTPALFKDELLSGDGDITVWINSPGGDCIAAAQIYNLLSDYKGKVTVKVDGIAASAASVIAMSGDEVLMSPVSMMMIHNPATMAVGVRAVKTMAQTAVATIGAAAMFDEVRWLAVGSATLLAGVLSILTSLAGLPEVG